MDKLVPILFLRGYGVYAPGEVAGFEEGKAASLIKSGVATDYHQKEEDPESVDQTDPNPEEDLEGEETENEESEGTGETRAARRNRRRNR